MLINLTLVKPVKNQKIMSMSKLLVKNTLKFYLKLKNVKKKQKFAH